MSMVFFYMLIISFISMIILSISFFFSDKMIKFSEKSSPFECGFSPMKKARSNFSVKFFFTTIIFLIFDIEIAVLMPLGVMKKVNFLDMGMISASIILIILLLGLLHEWKNKALKWMLWDSNL